MTAAVLAAGRRFLPHGWADFARQLVIWFGFFFIYQLARGMADRDPARAFSNGLKVIDIEQHGNALFELSVQRINDSSRVLMTLTNWTYWLSQFTVLGLALLWVYLRRHESFARFRNVVLLANVIGLVGYVLLPTAPPRMFPGFGFVDTLAQFASLNHTSGIVQLAANPYAAMPSLHAADSLLVGLVMASVARRWAVRLVWLAWPGWVAFSVLATGNHFWLDVMAGYFVAVIAAALIYRAPARAFIAKLL